MRYVVLAAGTMMFYLWDGMFNGGHYLDATVRTIHGFYAMFGLQ
jgi:hypothetical protein